MFVTALSRSNTEYMFWNIRGYVHSGRRTQLREYICQENIDVVGIQETIEREFRHTDFLAIDPLP